MVHRFIEYLRRMPRTRGFGVQSPTAYAFLRRVVKEKFFLATYNNINGYPYRASRQERLLYRLHFVYPQLVVLTHRQWCDVHYSGNILDNYGNDDVLVLLSIDNDRRSKDAWRQLTDDARCFQVFDMLDIGIVFFDATKPKQFFKVNY